MYGKKVHKRLFCFLIKRGDLVSYEINERGFPNYFNEREDQLWFESLQHIIECDIPFHMVTKTKLKSFGILVEYRNAVAWAYKSYNYEVHLLREIYLLYDIYQHKPSEKATEEQMERYNNYLIQLEKYKKDEINKHLFSR